MAETEAKFLFEEGLWREIRVHVYNAQCSNLSDSQSAAQRAGLVLVHADMLGKGKGKWKGKGQPFYSDSSKTGSGSGGPAPMVLGQAKGQAQAKQYDGRTCYKCGKVGHIAKDCRSRPAAAGAKSAQGQQNSTKGKGKIAQLEG